MIQILSVKDEEQRRLICNKADISYNESLHIIANFSENLLPQQSAVFSYTGESGEILWIETGDDMDLSVGLGKAVLSIMEIRGVKEVSLSKKFAKLAELLRFQYVGDQYKLSLEGYFSCGCQHK